MIDDRFWKLDDTDEFQFLERILRRRFPEIYAALSAALEESDPMDCVYPGNPGEYSDVVSEALVLLAWAAGDLEVLTDAGLEEILRAALGRCFVEPPDEDRLAILFGLLRRP
jgi:hypothetical protein